MSKRQRDETWLSDLVRARDLSASGRGDELRLAVGLSCAEWAEPIGVDPTTMWAWCRGKIRPSGDRAVAWVRSADQLARQLEAVINDDADVEHDHSVGDAEHHVGEHRHGGDLAARTSERCGP